jgi:aminoglycoside phosphotransferase (APT) family kinase protein
MNVEMDQAGPVRQGEELNLDRLTPYLAAHLSGPDLPLVVQQFPHGHSNLTYLVPIGAQEWVLRRPPFGNVVKSAHDMGREFRILSRLSAAYPLAPAPALYCDDESVLGAPFYIMERRRGVILRRPPPPDRSMPAELVRELCESLADGLALLHAVDYRAAGLEDLGKPQGYVERQVTGWLRRYQDARTNEIPALERAALWLSENKPADCAQPTLVHNDFKFDNLVLDPSDLTRVVAVLDWEMATIGDPLMDLGTTLGYWVEAGDPAPLHHHVVGPTALPGSLSRRELVDRYGQQTGRDVSNVLFYYVFGLFKIAVIAQQIYARYVNGLTKDERFAGMIQMVAALGLGAARAIDEQHL